MINQWLARVKSAACTGRESLPIKFFHDNQPSVKNLYLTAPDPPSLVPESFSVFLSPSFTTFFCFFFCKDPFHSPSLRTSFPFTAMADSPTATSNTEPTPASASTSSSSPPQIYMHPRREPFEHGLLPIPKLIFTDGTQTLGPIKNKLLSLVSSSPESSNRVNLNIIAETLQISPDHARLVLETIASVLHNDADPLVTSLPTEIDAVGVNVFDLVIFLYIQSYKRLLPKGHRDSAAVADVWPSTSAFDGFLSALSPLQVKNQIQFSGWKYLMLMPDHVWVVFKLVI